MSIGIFWLRLMVVIIVGILIGVERQLTGHSIGLKTTMLIALGTFSFVSSEILFGNCDMRMSANIITGIGFLCGSVIFKNGLTVNGLNTSATLWATSGISCLIAYGFLWQAISAAGMLIALNLVLNKVSANIKPLSKWIDDTESSYSINVVCLASEVEPVEDIILNNLTDDIDLVDLHWNAISDDKSRVIAEIEATRKQLKDIEKITRKIKEREVFSAGWKKVST